MTKKGRQFFFQEKIRVTRPSVAAPGDTHPSDATAWIESCDQEINDAVGCMLLHGNHGHGQIVHTCRPLSPGSIISYWSKAVMP